MAAAVLEVVEGAVEADGAGSSLGQRSSSGCRGLVRPSGDELAFCVACPEKGVALLRDGSTFYYKMGDRPDDDYLLFSTQLTGHSTHSTQKNECSTGFKLLKREYAWRCQA